MVPEFPDSATYKLSTDAEGATCSELSQAVFAAGVPPELTIDVRVPLRVHVLLQDDGPPVQHSDDESPNDSVIDAPEGAAQPALTAALPGPGNGHDCQNSAERIVSQMVIVTSSPGD
jgi:hypothetical protein